MGELRCVDGSVLSVDPVNCHDSAGRPYEITLSLARDSVPFAAVGQRCGYELAQLAERISAARDDPAQAAAWPDPDDRFPVPGAGENSREARGPARLAHGGTGRAAADANADHEYFALRSRDRVDPPGSGELRCVLRSSAVWLGECAGIGQHVPPRQRASQRPPSRPPAAGHGSWRLTRRAVIEAWGAGGVGVRAVLTSAELMAFLDTVLTGAASAEAGMAPTGQASRSDLSAGREAGGMAMSRGRQRGRVPDEVPQSRLPAVRAQA